jgi:hypothetical protein
LSMPISVCERERERERGRVSISRERERQHQQSLWKSRALWNKVRLVSEVWYRAVPAAKVDCLIVSYNRAAHDAATVYL